MASKMRAYARRLGLRYEGKQGRLKFERDTATHSVWWEVLQGTKPRGGGFAMPFEDLIPIINKYGPKVWCDFNEQLLRPGIYPEYPDDLRWPSDREKIIEMFKDMYYDRDPVEAMQKKAHTPMQTSDSSSAEKPWLSTHIGRPEPGVIRQIEDLFLTSLWIMTPNGSYLAELTLGGHQTIPSLFHAIEAVFISNKVAESPGADFSKEIVLPGHLQTLVIVFANLSPTLREPQVLDLDDSDQKLQILRRKIYEGFLMEREDIDGETIIGRATAFLEPGEPGQACPKSGDSLFGSSPASGTSIEVPLKNIVRQGML